jgi:hypothetical protein
MGGVHAIVPTVVEEITHLVSLENLGDALEILFLVRFELVAAGANGASGRRGAEKRDLFGTAPKRSGYALQASMTPRREALMTGVGPPLWATTMFRGRVILSSL